MPEAELVLRSAYRAFNARDIEAAIESMDPEVDWPNAWEGGRVVGRAAVRDYWKTVRRRLEQGRARGLHRGGRRESHCRCPSGRPRRRQRGAHLRFARSPLLPARGWPGGPDGRAGAAGPVETDPIAAPPFPAQSDSVAVTDDFRS